MNVNTSILFFGTSNFALPALQGLVTNGYNILGVVTKPDEPVGRRQILTSPPVKVLAQKNNIPVFQPESLKEYTDELPDADLYIVAAYGKIISQALLDKPRLGALNIHPSLLPRWRGPSPIQFAILYGDKETGVTIIKLDELMDHGPVVANSKWPIANSKTTYPELHDELADIGAQLLIEVLPKWIRGAIAAVPQDDVKATFSKMLTKEDGRINWEKPAEDIEREIRAFNPWPGTWTMWPDGDKICRVRIEYGLAVPDEPPVGSPGYIWYSRDYPLLVKTGHGSLAVHTLTLEGKKAMDAKTFLHGHPDLLETTFI